MLVKYRDILWLKWGKFYENLKSTLKSQCWGLGVVAVLLLANCSSASPDLPTGDELHILLHAPQGRSTYASALTKCLQSGGFTPTVEQVDSVAGFRYGSPAPAIPETQMVGSGVVSWALASARDELDAITLPVLPSEMSRAVWGTTEFIGELNPAGCDAIATRSAENSQYEKTRVSLFSRYGNEVTERVIADEEWIEADKLWARCMSKKGFADFHRPGDQLSYLQDQVDLAGQDVGALKRLLAEDVRITNAATVCGDEIAATRAEVGKRYDSQFVEAHETEILALLTADRSEG